ncbi:MAG: Secretion system C-terminal sorting domain, partial [Bacteroidota bacterium]
IVVNAQVTDTLGIGQYRLGSELLSVAPNGGFVFGNNGYNDVAKAQSFVNDESLVVRKVLLKFGEVQFASADSTSSIDVVIYTFGGSGVTLSSINDSVAPDTIRAAVSVPIHQLVANTYTEIDFGFDTIVFQSGERFFAGIDVSSLAAGDTVGLLSTTDGDANGANNSWELTVNGNWVLVAHGAYSWNLDVDLAIFVTIDEADPAGISSNSLNDWTCIPNPCATELRVDLPAKRSAEDFSVRVTSSNGQVVYMKDSCNEFEHLDVSDWSQGMYFVHITDGLNSSVQKVVKQ